MSEAEDIAKFLDTDVVSVTKAIALSSNGNTNPTPLFMPGHQSNSSSGTGIPSSKLFDTQLVLAELMHLLSKHKGELSWEENVKIIYLSLSAGDIHLARAILNNNLLNPGSNVDGAAWALDKMKSNEMRFIEAMIDYHEAEGKGSDLLLRAADAFKELQSLEPSSPVSVVAANNLAVAYLHQEKVQMALTILETAIKLNPSVAIKNTTLVFNLSRLYDFSKPTAEANKSKQILKKIGLYYANVDLDNAVLCIAPSKEVKN